MALVVVGLLCARRGQDVRGRPEGVSGSVRVHDRARGASGLFHVPRVVNATADSVGPAITLANAASSELSLAWMTIILCIGLPLVLVYHVVIYRTFRGRVNPADLEEY
ncbi:MAG: cytochrome d ubiquinol oxidase subunit II [Adlercreutzia sp.]